MPVMQQWDALQTNGWCVGDVCTPLHMRYRPGRKSNHKSPLPMTYSLTGATRTVSHLAACHDLVNFVDEHDAVLLHRLHGLADDLQQGVKSMVHQQGKGSVRQGSEIDGVAYVCHELPWFHD